MRGRLALGAALLGLLLAACASIAPEERALYPLLRGRPLHVLPVQDPSGALLPTETAKLRAEVEEGIRALGASSSRERRAREEAPLLGDIPIVPTPGAAEVLLSIEVARFDPEGSLAAAVVIGLGAGRPGYEVRLELRAGPAAPPQDREALAAAYTAARSRARKPGDPPDPSLAREALLLEVAREAVGLVRRRR